MLIHNAVITGSLTYNGVDISDITGSEASISALNSFSASMLNYTASNNVASASFSTRVVNLESTASVLTTASASFAIVSQSYASASGSLSTRVTNTETTASSLVTASGSFSTRVTNLELTGSSLVAASASFSTRVVSLESTASVLTTASASFAQQSGSNSTRLTNLESTASVLTTASASFAVVSSSYASASGSLSTRVTTIEGSYATTGSNVFVGNQGITSLSNAISFTSTGSLYTDGGLRITKDMYVSGTAFFNNVTIYGTQSVNYITSSQLNIGTNIITVNTDTPTVRYGGIAVYDSGSTGLTGSLLWDSEQNHWIYTNPSGSTYSGGMMISGPRASARGCEVGTTSCALMMGQGGDHITSSAILSYGNATCFYGNATITNTGNICTSTAAFTSCASVGTTVQCNVFVVKGVFSGGYYPSTATKVPLANFVGDNPEVLISDYSNDIGRTATLRLGTTDVDYYCYGVYVRAIQGSGVDSYSLAFGTSQNNPSTTKLTINGAGVSCFAGTVCSPSFIGGTICGTTGTFNNQLIASSVAGGTAAIFQNTGAQNSNGIEIRGGTTGTAVNWKIEKDNTLSNSLQITPSTAAGGTTYTTPVWTLTSTGIACFGNTICAKSLWFSSNSTGQITFGSNDACNPYVVSDSNNALYLGNNNSYKIFVPNDGADMIFRTSATYGNPQTRLTITSTGVTTFACQVCTPQALITNNIRVGTTYGTTAQYSFGSTVEAQTTANLTDAGVQCGILEVLATGGTAGNGGALMLGSDTWGTGAGKGQIALKALLVNGSGCGTSDLAFSLRNDPACANLTERMRITVGGNVGIGTSSPITTNLNGSLTIVKCYNGDTPPSPSAQSYDTNQSNLYLFGRNAGITLVGALNEEAVIAFGNSSDPYIGGIRYSMGSGADSGDFYIQTAGTNERLRILNTGIACFACTVCAPAFVGGTVTGTRMTVATDCSGVIVDVASRHGLMKYFNYSTGLVGCCTGTDGAISTWLGRFAGSITAPTAVYQDLVVTNTGNVGIGTTNAGAILTICNPAQSSTSTVTWQNGGRIKGNLYSDTGGIAIYTGEEFNSAAMYMVGNDQIQFRICSSTPKLLLTNAGCIACFAGTVCAPIHSATTRVLINSTCPCSMLMSIGGYGTTWGGNACYYGGGAAGGGGGIPNGDQYGNGSAYTYQTCNTCATNTSLFGGFSGGYFRGGDGGAYGGGGAGIVAIGGNGANAESVNSHGGSGLFARGGIDGNGGCIRFAAWFDGGDVVMRCGRMGIGTCAPTDKLHVFGADDGVTICSITANRPVLKFINGSTTMLKLSANDTYGAIASCTGDLMFFYGDKIGIGTTSPSFAFEVNSSNNTAITSNNTFGANLNIIFNRDNTGSTRNCFNILADQNSAYLRTLDNYPITFVTNGQNRTVISNTGETCFACIVCAPNFKFTSHGNIQSYVTSVGASTAKTVTICTDGAGVLNGALQVTVGLYVNGAGGNSVASWIVGGYMGAGAMRIVEVARSSDTYGCIGVMTNPSNCLIFTVGNCFGFNQMDISVMVTSVNANISALKIY